MSVWDILSGGRVVQTVCAHSKTITSLCADAAGAHLLSGSLDHMVKVYELRRYKVGSAGPASRAPGPSTPLARPQVVGSLKYAAPLLNVALSPTSSHLVVGMSDNSLCVRRQTAALGDAGASGSGSEGRHRRGDSSDLHSVGLPGQVASAETAVPNGAPQDGSTYRYFLRGRNHAPQVRHPQHVRAVASSHRYSSHVAAGGDGHRAHSGSPAQRI